MGHPESLPRAASCAEWLVFKPKGVNADPVNVSASASFRAPYWAAFAATAAVAPLGIVVVALWIDYLAHLMNGAALAVVAAQVVLLVGVSGVAASRFEYFTLYRLELDAGRIRGRSTLKSWDFSLSDVEAIVPGWARPWWIVDHNRYVVQLAGEGGSSSGAAKVSTTSCNASRPKSRGWGSKTTFAVTGSSGPVGGPGSRRGDQLAAAISVGGPSGVTTRGPFPTSEVFSTSLMRIDAPSTAASNDRCSDEM